MTKANELVKRIVAEFEARGFTVNLKSNGDYRVKNDFNRKVIEIRETYRHNGTSENATARIEVINLSAMFDTSLETSLYKTKIPYEASNKLINNRIDKALEKFLYTGEKPFTMDMLDGFYQ